MFASSFSSGLISGVRAMTRLLRWTAFLWIVNSISCTSGMAVSEQTGICLCCLHFPCHKYVCDNMKCTDQFCLIVVEVKNRMGVWQHNM